MPAKPIPRSKILRLHREGVRLSEIAKRCGVPKARVRAVVEKLGKENKKTKAIFKWEDRQFASSGCLSVGNILAGLVLEVAEYENGVWKAMTYGLHPEKNNLIFNDHELLSAGFRLPSSFPIRDAAKRAVEEYVRKWFIEAGEAMKEGIE